MTFSERLSGLIRQRGVSNRAVGRAVGASHVSVNRWLNGGKPDEEFLGKLSDYFGVSRSWLLFGEGETPKGNIKTFVPGEDVPPAGFVCVHEYTLRLHAGDGCEPEWEETQGGEDFWYRASFFQRLRVNPEKCKRARVAGDSMCPYICAGDHVLFAESANTSPKEACIVDGAVYVMSVGGVMRIKRLSRTKDGIVVRSDNPAYPPEVYTFAECDENYVHIYGRVIEINRSAL